MRQVRPRLNETMDVLELIHHLMVALVDFIVGHVVNPMIVVRSLKSGRL